MQAGRVSETDLIQPLLEYLSTQPDGFASTSDIIRHLEGVLQPIGEDAEVLDNRSDTKFSQKVRNLISHRGLPSGVVSKGLVEYDDLRRGLKITEYGRRSIKSA